MKRWPRERAPVARPMLPLVSLLLLLRFGDAEVEVTSLGDTNVATEPFDHSAHLQYHDPVNRLLTSLGTFGRRTPSEGVATLAKRSLPNYAVVRKALCILLQQKLVGRFQPSGCDSSGPKRAYFRAWGGKRSLLAPINQNSHGKTADHVVKPRKTMKSDHPEAANWFRNGDILTARISEEELLKPATKSSLRSYPVTTGIQTDVPRNADEDIQESYSMPMRHRRNTEGDESSFSEDSLSGRDPEKTESRREEIVVHNSSNAERERIQSPEDAFFDSTDRIKRVAHVSDAEHDLDVFSGRSSASNEYIFQPEDGYSSENVNFPSNGKQMDRLEELKYVDDLADGHSQNEIVKSLIGTLAEKRARFSAWGGKRNIPEEMEKRARFSSWGGKRDPFYIDKKARFSAWGGKRTLPIFGGTDGQIETLAKQRDITHMEKADGLIPFDGRDKSLFESHLRNMESYLAKRARFSAWGGKRSNRDEDKTTEFILNV